MGPVWPVYWRDQFHQSEPNMTGRLIAAVSLVLLLAGCGQKGPLYLPAPEPPTAVESNAAQDNDQSGKGADEQSR